MQSLASEPAPSTHQPALASQPAPCTHQPADPTLDEANPSSSRDAVVLLTAHPQKQSAQNNASATVALAGTTKRSRSAQAFEEDDASSSSGSRQAGSPSTSVPSEAMNKSAKRARHSSPQSNQQAELPTASAAEELSTSGSPSPEQLVACECEAELPLQPDAEQEVPSSGDTEPGRSADVKDKESEIDVPVEEQGSLVDADEEEESSSDEDSAGQEAAGVNKAAEEASTSEETQVKKKKRLHSSQIMPLMMSAAQQVQARGRSLHHMTLQRQTCSHMAPQMMTKKKWQLTAQRNCQNQMTGWNHSQ